MITAVLLAAGESRRMGAFKQLLPLGEKTFVEHCVDQLLASAVDEVIVVTGHRRADVERVLGARAVRFAHNDEYRSGMASSIKRGILAASETTRAFVIALVDQPQIDAGTVGALVQAHEKQQPAIVIPTYQGKSGHPILVDAQLKQEILSMDVGEGLRHVVRAHAGEIVRVEVPSPAVVTDFDLPEDYERLLSS